MANNFRLTGNVYVSKDGSNANSGLTPDLPKLTVQAGLNALTSGQTLVIASGVYKENISRSITLTIICDGLVIMEGDGISTSFTLSAGNPTIRNVYFRNYLSVISTGASNWYDCVFEGGNSSSINTSFYRCKFINSIGSVSSSPNQFYSCIFINTFWGTSVGGAVGPNALLSCYVDSTSIISCNSGITAANFNFNNIQGKIIMNTGTYSGIALSFADHRTYYPTFNVQSFSSDPLFNDVQNLDFTLQAASPHIRAANDYISNIGGTEYAKHYDADDAEFTSGATITNLTLRGDNSYTITSPATEGRIVTAPLAVQSYPATKPLTGIIWNGSLEFNKSVTAGTQGNQNVPAYETYTTGAGAMPDRLKIKMRYSTQSASPTAGQWDNGGYWTVDTYQLVEVNMKPKVDSNGIGNGDYTYIEFVGLGDLVPTWIQLDIKLRNDYAI